MMGHLRVSSLLIGCTLEGIRSINQPTNSKRPSMNDWHHAMWLILNLAGASLSCTWSPWSGVKVQRHVCCTSESSLVGASLAICSLCCHLPFAVCVVTCHLQSYWIVCLYIMSGIYQPNIKRTDMTQCDWTQHDRAAKRLWWRINNPNSTKQNTKQGQRDLSVRDSSHTRTSAASKTEISTDLEAQRKSQTQNSKSQTQNIKSRTQNTKARTQKISIDLNRSQNSQNISNGKQPWN